MWSYVSVLLFTATFVLGGVVGINSVLDPFWLLGFSSALNSHKYAFDERAQKTNLLLNSNSLYTGVILGSSRATYIDPRDFKREHFFNYAASSMYPSEYQRFLQIARSRYPIKAVVIGVDFFGTNKRQPLGVAESPLEYAKRAATLRGKVGMLTSVDGLRYAWLTGECSVFAVCPFDYYDEQFVKMMRRRTDAGRDRELLGQLRLYQQHVYGKSYVWNDELPRWFSMLRSANPDVRFQVFTTPISAPLWSLLIDSGRFPDYSRWIRLLVEEFGGVYDFLGFNSVTIDLNNYADAHHFTPQIGTAIADRLEGRIDDVAGEFGILVTRENLEEHLRAMATAAHQADRDPISTFEARVSPVRGE